MIFVSLHKTSRLLREEEARKEPQRRKLGLMDNVYTLVGHKENSPAADPLAIVTIF